MRICLRVALFCLLFACFCLAGPAFPVFAAPARMTTSARPVEQTVPVHRWHGRAWWWHFHPGGPVGWEMNQYHQGDSNYNNTSVTHGGSDQGNSGNNGWNRGHIQDNSSNGGNQLVVSPRLGRYHRINQYTVGNSNYHNNYYRWGGFNQQNTGNPGHNDGFSQDNSSNGGNQIIG